MVPQNSFDLQSALSSIQGQLAQIRPNTYYTPPQMPAYMSQAPMPQQPQPQPELLYRQVSKVHGIAGAQEYQNKLAAGSSEIIVDDENNIFYLVMKDANGNAPEQITVGDFKLRKQKVEETAYVTRQDFDAFTAEIRQLLTKENKDG